MPSSGKLEKGFTLVELMVALVLGLLVVAAAIQVFLTFNRTSFFVDQLASSQEKLRFIPDVLSVDVRTADVMVIDPLIDPLDENSGVDYSACNPSSTNILGASGVGKVLRLRYSDTRRNDPYCTESGQPDLKEVRYFSVEDSGNLSVLACYVCSNGNGSALSYVPGGSLSSAFELQGGVGLVFSAPALGVVDFEVKLDSSAALPGQGEDDRTFSFRVLSRGVLLSELGL